MKEKEVVVLEQNGATNIKEYVLISNYGYTFEIDGARYDARYWANCYGCALNVWQVHSLNKNSDGTYIPVPEELKEKLERELNA